MDEDALLFMRSMQPSASRKEDRDLSGEDCEFHPRSPFHVRVTGMAASMIVCTSHTHTPPPCPRLPDLYYPSVASEGDLSFCSATEIERGRDFLVHLEVIMCGGWPCQVCDQEVTV